MKTKMLLFVGLLFAGLIFSSCQKDNDLIADASIDQTAEQKRLPPDGDIGGFNDINVDLLSNVPDPFTQRTTIEYELPKPGWVTIYVKNVREGYSIRLVSEFKPAGHYKVVFEARNHPPGLYMAEMKTGGQLIREQMLKVLEEGNGTIFGR